MTEIVPGRTFSDIAQRAGKATPYWDRADEALTSHRPCLTQYSDGESIYVVTPSVTHKCKDTKLTFAIAGLMNGKTLTQTRFLVINNDFSNLLVFQRYGDDPLHHFTSNEVIVDENLDAVLNKINGAVKLEATRAKNKRDRHDEQVTKTIGTVFIAGLIVGVVVLVAWGFVAFINLMNAPAREAEQKIAAFDQQYPDFVIQGKRFDIDTAGTLTSNAPDISKDVPGKPSQAIDLHARSFTVPTGQCADSDKRDEVGHITGDQYLVAQTNAPDGVIEVKIDKVGGVSVCANDPEGLGNRGPRYPVLLQVQPKK